MAAHGDLSRHRMAIPRCTRTATAQWPSFRWDRAAVLRAQRSRPTSSATPGASTSSSAAGTATPIFRPVDRLRTRHGQPESSPAKHPIDAERLPVPATRLPAIGIPPRKPRLPIDTKLPSDGPARSVQAIARGSLRLNRHDHPQAIIQASAVAGGVATSGVLAPSRWWPAPHPRRGLACRGGPDTRCA